MRLLLDSNALLWWTGLHHDRLTDAARKSIAEADQLFVRGATIWELEIKRGIGKLDFALDAWERVEALGMSWLPIERDDAIDAGRLPLLHRDPFDRLIVAQAMRRQLTLVTSDSSLGAYGVALLSA